MRAIWSAVVLAAVAAFLIPGLGSAAGQGFRLTVVVTGNGTVSTSDGRIVNCADECTADYENQETVELSAKPGGTSESFLGWGGECQGTTKCTVTMTAHRDVTAEFTGTGPEPSPTATSEPSPTATSEASPTATSEPSPTATPAPSATASPAPTATPAPSQSPATVAAHLIRRVPKFRTVPPRPRTLTFNAARRFKCRRPCIVAAVLRSGKTTLARGSRRVRAGGRPGVTLRFGKRGRALGSGDHRARLRLTVHVDGHFARRARAVTLRVSG